ncbi:MAG: acetylornithine transaminase [Actinobacteria bacterium]|nr:acetylornithine transaminase [Actinomycetota bacterium]MBI3687679.1 acetylornithine transaminase [Actinomycetota bacterium]
MSGIDEAVTDAALRARFEAAFMATYSTPPVALLRGAGVHAWDADGRQYLDCIGGIAVSVLGHAHPAVVAAVTEQVGTLVHTSNLAMNLPALLLGERLRALAGGAARVFLCNSGTEANEAALKVVRRYWAGARTRIVALEGSFHGRTLGALSITGQPAKRAPFEPLVPDIVFVPHGDVAALRAAVTGQTAAVFCEPVLGEAGVIPAPPGFLEAARQACTDTGALLVLDEIQGGMGRTGEWFSHQSLAPGVRADVLTLAKGLGGGLPIGACLAMGPAADALRPGDHGSTFGGNPVCCAAALAVLDTIEEGDLRAHARVAGDRLAAGIAALAHPLVDHVRGLGLWRAVVLRRPVARQVEQAARRAGLLLNAAQPDVLRLAPALVIELTDVDRVVVALHEALNSTLVSTPEGS